MPGAPTARNVSCHAEKPANTPVPPPAKLAIATPPNREDAALPSAAPISIVPIARPRVCGEKMSAMIDTAAGARHASPIPTNMRATNSAGKLCAKPQAIVLTLQHNMPTMMTLRRLPRSTIRAIGRPAMA